MCKNRKVVITTGGTGGHVFPAEALAKQLLQESYDVTFIGGGLQTNRYFHRHEFKFQEVVVSPFFQLNIFKAFWRICKGTWQSLKNLKAINPEMVIGFGSFYTFPVLLAAYLKKIPIVLFESNAIPGKVNRLFSWLGALCTVQFKEAGKHLSGPIIEVKMPVLEKIEVDKSLAREYFYLCPHLLTILVFGGSQGADTINSFFSETIAELKSDAPFQVIHVTGKTDSAEKLRQFYAQRSIPACVKAFEERMHLAWHAASIVICRSGAATIAEQMRYAVPGIFIPFARASDDHQTQNAIFVEKEVKGGFTCPESKLSVEYLKYLLENMLFSGKKEEMKQAIIYFNQRQNQEELSAIIKQFMQG
ncbi:MAG: UDP-N-acetylglucosamine--N-acetylmuramyl-(pentapeptide) pyrophosphoryl-undecaprenol N-acetylglucosamine transferase [Candidatus Rhabdochlamydia sp.]